MRTVMLMVPTWPESGFLDVPLACGLLPGAGGEVNAASRSGRAKQKVEMTVGDFGAPDVGRRALVGEGLHPHRSASSASEVYVQGTVGGRGLHPHRRTAESWSPALGRR